MNWWMCRVFYMHYNLGLCNHQCNIHTYYVHTCETCLHCIIDYDMYSSFSDRKHFGPKDAFVGFQEETPAAIVLHACQVLGEYSHSEVSNHIVNSQGKYFQ